MPRDHYFWNADEFLIDGVPVTIGEADFYVAEFVGGGRVKTLTWVAEKLFHRRLLHRTEVENIIHNHYDGPELQDIHLCLYKAEWAYDTSRTGYMTKRQLVRALPKRRRCKFCGKRAQYFKRWHCSGTPMHYARFPQKDIEFCSRECFHNRGRKLEREQKRRKRQWKEILIAKSKLKAVRRWLRMPSDRDPSLTQSGE